MKTVIVMPAHNEEKTIGEIIRKCRAYGKVIVVNDASTDSTEKIAKKEGALVISHKKNKGLGSALRTGFSEALRSKAGVIITIDADGQHLPEDIPKFIKKIQEGCDFVLGERDLSNYPLVKKIGNFFLNYATNLVCRTRLKDTESGFRAFTRQALEKMSLKADKYEIAAEMVREVGRNRLKTANVPVKVPFYVKGVRVKDGVKNFFYLLHN